MILSQVIAMMIGKSVSSKRQKYYMWNNFMQDNKRKYFHEV